MYERDVLDEKQRRNGRMRRERETETYMYWTRKEKMADANL